MQKQLHPVTDEAIFHELTAVVRRGEATRAKVLLSQRFVRPAAGASRAVCSAAAALAGCMDDASLRYTAVFGLQPPLNLSRLSARQSPHTGAGETQVSFPLGCLSLDYAACLMPL